MRLDDIEQIIKDLDENIEYKNVDRTRSNLEILKSLTDISLIDSVSEKQLIRYIWNRAITIGMHLGNGDDISARLNVAEIRGYISGINFSQEGMLEEMVSEEDSGLMEKSNESGLRYNSKTEEVSVDGIILESITKMRKGIVKYLLNREAQLISLSEDQYDMHPGLVPISTEEVRLSLREVYGRTVSYKSTRRQMDILKEELEKGSENPPFIEKEYGGGYNFTSNPRSIEQYKPFIYIRYDPKTGEYERGNESGKLTGRAKEVMNIYSRYPGKTRDSYVVANQVWGSDSSIHNLSTIIYEIKIKMDVDGEPSVFDGTLGKGFRVTLMPNS